MIFHFIDLFFIALVFLIGAITSFEDIKYGKIRNQWILLGFFVGGIFFILLFRLAIINNVNYLLQVILNTIIAFWVGYFMWQYNLWAAGDAKLFTLYAFLVPLGYYSNWYFEYFPSIALLINTFLLALCYLLGRAAYFLLINGNVIRNFTKEAPKKIKEQGVSILRTFPILVLIFLIIGIVELPFNPLFLFIVLFFAIRPLSKAMGKNKILNLILIIFLTITLLLVWGGTIGDLGEVIKISSTRMALFVAVFMGLNFVSELYLKEEKQKKTFFALWMFLGVIITFIIKGSLLSFILNYLFKF